LFTQTCVLVAEMNKNISALARFNEAESPDVIEHSNLALHFTFSSFADCS